MRNMSFSMTTQQVRDRTKTVTRRLGWRFLKPGDVVCAVRKAMGLKKGEGVEKLATIRIVSVRRERLNRLILDFDYGFDEIVKEGFEYHPIVYGSPLAFIEWLISWNRKLTPDTEITRIEFEYVNWTPPESTRKL